jgi:hypothetical protein
LQQGVPHQHRNNEIKNGIVDTAQNKSQQKSEKPSGRRQGTEGKGVGIESA